MYRSSSGATSGTTAFLFYELQAADRTRIRAVHLGRSPVSRAVGAGLVPPSRGTVEWAATRAAPTATCIPPQAAPLPSRLSRLLEAFPADELSTLVETRRDLHRFPELAFEERRTAGRAAERLRAAGLSPREGVGRTGVTADHGAGGSRLLLRADMDGLPLEEATGAPYASENAGRMHACGHDGHVAIGLAAAERLVRARTAGTFRFLFQPAEEGAGGAEECVGDGALEGIRAAFGLHLWNQMPLGKVTPPLKIAALDLHVAHEEDRHRRHLARLHFLHLLHARFLFRRIRRNRARHAAPRERRDAVRAHLVARHIERDAFGKRCDPEFRCGVVRLARGRRPVSAAVNRCASRRSNRAFTASAARQLRMSPGGEHAQVASKSTRTPSIIGDGHNRRQRMSWAAFS